MYIFLFNNRSLEGLLVRHSIRFLLVVSFFFLGAVLCLIDDARQLMTSTPSLQDRWPFWQAACALLFPTIMFWCHRWWYKQDAHFRARRLAELEKDSAFNPEKLPDVDRSI
jgi:hypothetical protein